MCLSCDDTDFYVQNLYLVSLGTIIGHSCCTALAVIGGRYISTKISPKHGTLHLCIQPFLCLTQSIVTLGGAFLFLSFGFIYLYTAIYMADDADPELSSLSFSLSSVDSLPIPAVDVDAVPAVVPVAR